MSHTTTPNHTKAHVAKVDAIAAIWGSADELAANSTYLWLRINDSAQPLSAAQLTTIARAIAKADDLVCSAIGIVEDSRTKNEFAR